ncbi:MAG: sulfate permease [Bacteroidetes bacterium]|nr:sulfate permease [Bacteroidota bacterium]
MLRIPTPPLIQDLRQYNRLIFRGDLQAGLTVGVVLIPQAMAYAMLAGLPPVYGLYAAVFPLLIYAFLGSSRQLSMGPAALLSLLILAGISPLAAPQTPEYIRWAFVLAMAVGLLQFLIGVFRLGFLVNFLSAPVISGFTTASALVIMLTQTDALLGLTPAHGMGFPARIHHLLHSIPAMHGPTVALGLSTVLLLLGARYYFPRFPGALFAIGYGMACSLVFHLERRGVAVLGEIPRGFPAPGMPAFEAGDFLILLPSILSISLMGFVISFAVARSIPAESRRQRMDPNQELIAQGLANLGGSFLQSFPVAGSFARTAVNYQAGAQTGVSALISVGMVLLTVLLLTPWLHFLPLAVLGAIIVVAVSDLIQWRIARHLYQTDMRDLLMLVATFGTTLWLGMENGIVAGVVLSLSAVLYSSSRPHYAVLGRLPNTTVYKNIDRFQEAEEEEGVLILRPDARLFFGNQDYIREVVEREVAFRPETELVILDGVAISDVDSTAVSMLRVLERELGLQGIRLRFIGLNGPVRDKLYKNHLDMIIGSNHVYTRIHDLILQFREEGEGPVHPRQVSIRSSGSGGSHSQVNRARPRNRFLYPGEEEE